MNEKMQYAEMLEIPVNTCNITYKPSSRWRRKKASSPQSVDAKKELIDKINAGAPTVDQENGVENDAFYGDAEYAKDLMEQNSEVPSEAYDQPENYEEQNYVKITRTDKPKKKFRLKFSVVGVQVAVICMLLATILLTNAFMPNSGINTFIANVFQPQATVEQKDQRIYSEFKPILPVESAETVSVTDGVMNFSAGGSLYSPCDGTVSNVIKEADGTFTLEIAHSENFKTVFSGIDYAYCAQGDKVYSNIPVGYMIDDGATMCFYDGLDTAITDYSIEENSLKWAV